MCVVTILRMSLKLILSIHWGRIGRKQTGSSSLWKHNSTLQLCQLFVTTVARIPVGIVVNGMWFLGWLSYGISCFL